MTESEQLAYELGVEFSVKICSELWNEGRFVQDVTQHIKELCLMEVDEALETSRC
jgi:hypothetical protein